jgi:hypothetical protein
LLPSKRGGAELSIIGGFQWSAGGMYPPEELLPPEEPPELPPEEPPEPPPLLEES